MKLPQHILEYAREQCEMKDVSDKNIFRLVKMLFGNKFTPEEIENLLGHIEIILEWI